jgi:hypothetical protein
MITDDENSRATSRAVSPERRDSGNNEGDDSGNNEAAPQAPAMPIMSPMKAVAAPGDSADSFAMFDSFQMMPDESLLELGDVPL